MTDKSVTQLLREWRDGNQLARDELIPLVYRQLRALAGKLMASERRDHTFPATALVHEAYLRLVDADVPWQDRAHFFTLAARQMRHILVDYARSQGRRKRGGGVPVVALEEITTVSSDASSVLPEVDEALERLASMDPRKGQVVELIYFGGLTYDEVALALGISKVTVHRELRLAKAWLYKELKAVG
jgi:RNA polymerase sigma factor (TIGR02999 family)